MFEKFMNRPDVANKIIKLVDAVIFLKEIGGNKNELAVGKIVNLNIIKKKLIANGESLFIDWSIEVKIEVLFIP